MTSMLMNVSHPCILDSLLFTLGEVEEHIEACEIAASVYYGLRLLAL